MPGDVNADTFPNNLPPELLAEIFVLTHCSPITLGNVCIIWRAITSSTPALWSHITLRVAHPNRQPKKYANQLSFFKNQLARSGEIPLTLKVEIKTGAYKKDYRSRPHQQPWDGTNPIPIELVRLLADSAHRWQSFDFWAIPKAWHPFLEEAIKLMPNGFQHLHTLKIIPPARNNFRLALPPWRLDLFSVAPALKTVELTGCRLTDVDVPWCQLTSLSLHGNTRSECFYALREAPNLEYLEVQPGRGSFDGKEQLPWDSRTPYSQLALKHLVIGRRPMELFGRLSAPQLHTLELIAADRLDVSDLLGLPQLFESLGCQLRRLKLGGINIPSRNEMMINIVHLLREISSLEELEIKMAVISGPVTDTDLFVELLKRDPASSTHFLPNLAVFSYTGPIQAVYRFDQPIFHQLGYRHGLAAAERNLHPLSSFHINALGLYSPFRTDAAQSNRLLADLYEGGLQFRFACEVEVIFGTKSIRSSYICS